MKQYTNAEQTAKLIELGFEKPKSVRYPRNEMEVERVNTTDFLVSDYSIGELIEILDGVSGLEITRFGSGWDIYDDLRAFSSEELIDALYDMIVYLKEEEVI